MRYPSNLSDRGKEESDTHQKMSKDYARHETATLHRQKYRRTTHIQYTFFSAAIKQNSACNFTAHAHTQSRVFAIKDGGVCQPSCREQTEVTTSYRQGFCQNVKYESLTPGNITDSLVSSF